MSTHAAQKRRGAMIALVRGGLHVELLHSGKRLKATSFGGT
jgi:hypothetical protein